MSPTAAACAPKVEAAEELAESLGFMMNHAAPATTNATATATIATSAVE
jgi:hypothetical protein